MAMQGGMTEHAPGYYSWGHDDSTTGYFAGQLVDGHPWNVSFCAVWQAAELQESVAATIQPCDSHNIMQNECAVWLLRKTHLLDTSTLPSLSRTSSERC